MRDVSHLLAALDAAGDRPLVLATVLRTQGPAYRRAGAMALLAADGSVLAGSVSAGCLEDDVRERAPRVLAAAHPERVTYDADGGPFAIPSGCGGRVEILLEPLPDAAAREPVVGWLRALATIAAPGIGGVVLKPRADGCCGLARLVWADDGEWWFNPAVGAALTGDERAAIRRDAPRAAAARTADVRRYAACDVAWQPVTPRPQLVIGGALPDAVPVAAQMVALGWRVRVADHREGRRTEFPAVGAEVLAVEPSALPALTGRDAHTAALVMYHAVAADREAVRALAAEPPGFVGVLGPRRRTMRLLEGTALAASTAWPAWLRAPVGLDLGADDAEEIALSIAAELLAWHRHASAAPLSGRDGPLHATGHPASLEGAIAPWPT